MNRDTARLTLALAGTMSADPWERAMSTLYLATGRSARKLPTWWQWTSWLGLGITGARLCAAMRAGTLGSRAFREA